MLDVELRDALVRHSHTLDERAPAITLDELDARRTSARVTRRAPRRTNGPVALALTLVVVIVVAIAVFRGTPDATSPARQPSGPDAKQLSNYHWSEIPESPSPGRADAATVWLGHEVIEWGGATGGADGAVTNVGTAYDPRRNAWRVIAPSPLSQRRAAASVWTGQALFIRGGTGTFEEQTVTDGALYDQRENEWRMLPRSPLLGRSAAQAFWTGREVIVPPAASWDPRPGYLGSEHGRSTTREQTAGAVCRPRR